jgi:signal transduction histidine kinase
VTVGARATTDASRCASSTRASGIPPRARADLPEVLPSESRRATARRTGLGLFIAEELVHGDGRRIWVDSEEGEGSSFAFELPWRAD